MNLTIPPELQEALAARAARQHLSTEEVVRQAIVWYLQTEAALQEELDDWQAIRDEALELIDEGGA
jgi:hypothetical protein